MNSTVPARAGFVHYHLIKMSQKKQVVVHKVNRKQKQNSLIKKKERKKNNQEYLEVVIKQNNIIKMRGNSRDQSC